MAYGSLLPPALAYEPMDETMFRMMKMKTIKKCRLTVTALSLVLGIALTIVRATASPSLLLVFALLVLLALAGFSLLTSGKDDPAEGVQPGKPTFALLALAGFLFLIAGVCFWLDEAAFELRSGASGLLRGVMAIFALLCGICTLMRLSARDQGGKSAAYAVPPIFCLAIGLLLFYRGNGDNPYLESFAPEILTLMFTLLGVYFAVQPRFEVRKIWLYHSVLSVSLAAIVQELLYALMHWEQVHSIPCFSLATPMLLAACGLLILNALLFPAEKLPPLPSDEKKNEDGEEPSEEASEENADTPEEGQ